MDLKLKLEFSRISKDARLTLVLDPTGTTLPTLHRKSSRSCLMDAAADLRDREGTVFKHIGFVTADGKTTSLTKYSEQFRFLGKSLPVRQIRAEISHTIFERIALVPASYLVTRY